MVIRSAWNSIVHEENFITNRLKSLPFTIKLTLRISFEKDYKSREEHNSLEKRKTKQINNKNYNTSNIEKNFSSLLDIVFSTENPQIAIKEEINGIIE